MATLLRLVINELADSYAKLFSAVWKKGHSQRLVAKNIKYSLLRPERLRRPVAFMHGPRRDLSLPYDVCVLLSKNRVRERGGKVLAVAILDAWIRKEPLTIEYLKWLLQL